MRGNICRATIRVKSSSDQYFFPEQPPVFLHSANSVHSRHVDGPAWPWPLLADALRGQDVRASLPLEHLLYLHVDPVLRGHRHPGLLRDTPLSTGLALLPEQKERGKVERAARPVRRRPASVRHHPTAYLQ